MVQVESSEPVTNVETSKLFQPIQVGDVTLAHRVVLAPLTRHRANKHGVHGDLAVGYYSQRASVPGSLLISEATYVSRKAEGRSPNVPGVWNEQQIAGWKRVSRSGKCMACGTDTHALYVTGGGCRPCERLVHIHAAVGPWARGEDRIPSRAGSRLCFCRAIGHSSRWQGRHPAPSDSRRCVTLSTVPLRLD